MKIITRQDGYWIVNCPMGIPDMGPYAKRHGKDADHSVSQAKQDLERFILFDYWEDFTPNKKVKVKVRRLT